MDPILVTGASRRVGLHIAQRLHADGYKVLAHYRTETDGVQSLRDAGVDLIQADFDSQSAILSFVQLLKTRYPNYRGIIHNASTFTPTESDLTAAASQYAAFFHVHMLAPFLINQALAEQLRGEQDSPADIVHITDINAENPTPRFDSYGTTKAGLHNMMLAMAKKLAPKIKVNAVAPGPVLFNVSHTPAARQEMLSETPLACEGGAEPVYLAVRSLLQNPFLTGVSIPVDGGRRLSKK
ncbi:FolM Alternative dihydrofolate reductase 1 [Methylophaga frappieri]|uniref:Dihydromonapterin reductase n=1 Tax=Methylophaga frappieri (strain ATCC BAA-2434 / DSM 25690 / JAM7) TaxID=754477 RepID=I1YJR2_METFJ|nr:SDR family NAD(P)-dependent oxidoreductase [Methylophaga frappieri]AFJ03155.1 FolM Alternative dihydrofolate reductase 1 [Methylophaga frappieri]